MIPFIFFSSATLGIIGGLFPFTFLGVFLLFNIFFHFQYEKFAFIGGETSTYRIFVLALLMSFLIKNLRGFDTKAFKENWWIIFGIGFLISLVAIFHYQCWGRLPTFYFTNQLKAFWPLLFLFFKTEGPDYKKIITFLGWVVFGTLLITIYSYFDIFNYTHISLWRLREPQLLNTVTPTFIHHSKEFSFFTFDETSVLILTFALSGLAYLIFHHERIKNHRWIQLLLMLFFSSYILISQMLKSIAIWIIFICTKILFFSRKDLVKKLINISLLLMILLSVLLLVESKLKIFQRFVSEEINYQQEVNIYTRRIPRFLFTLNKSLEHPWKGAGFPQTFTDDEILPSGLRWRASSGHSYIIDCFFYFGLVFGGAACVLVWLPFLFTLLCYKKIKNDSLKSYFFVNSSLSLFLMGFAGIWGESTVTLVIAFYLIVLLMKERVTVKVID